MKNIITPLHSLVTTLACWINDWQAQRIAFLCKQIEAYQRIAGTGRLPFTDKERRELAVLGKRIGLDALRELPTLVQPETILAWHRRLVARKFDYSGRRRGPGRPRIMEQIRALILHMATDNPLWSPLGRPGSHRLLHCRSVDTARLGHLLRAFLHRARHETIRNRGYHHKSRRTIHGASSS